MPWFRIVQISSGIVVGDFEAESADAAPAVLARHCGYSDFDDLAASMELPADKALKDLRVREISESVARAGLVGARKTRNKRTRGDPSFVS